MALQWMSDWIKGPTLPWPVARTGGGGQLSPAQRDLGRAGAVAPGGVAIADVPVLPTRSAQAQEGGRRTPAWPRAVRHGLLCAALACGLVACDHVPTRNAGAAAGVLVAAHIPTTQFQQVYYLGVFDPRDQVPPMIYRLRIQGQASMLNRTNFASGWVHANVLDSLSPAPGHDATLAALSGRGGAGKNGDEKSSLTGRRLVMFGPEGFRDAPKDHRLVVVMGSDPSGFFGAIDRALGTVAEATQGVTASAELTRLLLDEQALLRAEGKQLAAVAKAAAASAAP